MIANSFSVSSFTFGCVLYVTASAFAADHAAFSSSASAQGPREHRPFLSNGEKATPYLTLSGLDSWIVESENGTKRLVFVTADGMTLDGPIRDENGRNLSEALLGSPETVSRTSPTPHAEIQKLPVEQDLSEPSKPNVLPNEIPASPEMSAEQSAVPQSHALSMTPASSVDDLLAEAGRKVWFSAGDPKPNAPVLYFMADPTCIHCAASTEKLGPYIASGDIDVRVILAPVRSRESVFEAASILQSPNIKTDFFSHETAQVGSATSSLTVLEPSEINADVVRGLQHNVAWGRANGVEGVPFWIYEGPDGAKVAAGRVTDAIIDEVKPLPVALAQETAP